MASEFHLPDIGEGLTEAVIISWYAGIGESVGLDDPLVEIETDKAVVDIPSPDAGILLHQGASEGETIPVGAILAVIGEPGEEWAPNNESDREAGTEAAGLPIIGSLEEAPPAGRPKATTALPRVRRLATDLGVDLATIPGTGPGGRVTEGDVRSAAESRPTTRRPMSPTRRAIAANLTRSWREIPHVTTFGEAAAEPIFEARAQMGNPPLEALLIALACPLLEDYPAFNSAADGEVIVERHFFDVGFAVDTPDGLIVAVVQEAAAMSVAQLATEVERLAEGARARTLPPERLRGQSFTISNIGAVGGGYGTPIIPHGTSAILSVGRAVERPVARAGEVVLGLEFPLSLSYDHRLIDGAMGRRFMSALSAAIEDPTTLG